MKNIFFTLTVDEQVLRTIISVAKRKKMTIELKMIVNQAKHRASKAFWKMQVIVKKVF